MAAETLVEIITVRLGIEKPVRKYWLRGSARKAGICFLDVPCAQVIINISQKKRALEESVTKMQT